MKHRRVFALLLAAALFAALFAGCSREEAPVEENQAAVVEETAPAEPAVDAAAVSESVAPPAETPSQEAATALSEDGTFTSPGGIVYPIGDGSQHVNYWTSFGWEMFGYSSYEEMLALPEQTEKTGIKLDFIEVSNSASTEQFNLMIASGDWPDSFGSSNYTGGAGQAYEDDVIVDMTDDLPVFAPDYWAELNTWDETNIMRTVKDGRFLFMSCIETNFMLDTGLATRGDWLDELGMDLPYTLQEYTDMLYTMHDTYGCAYTIGNPGQDSTYLKACFNSTIIVPNSESSSTLTVFVGDNQDIQCGYTAPGYRDYLEWFIQLYNDGLIFQDFYCDGFDMAEGQGYIANGDTAVWDSGADRLTQQLTYADDPNALWICQPIPYLVKESGDAYTWKGESNEGTRDNGLCITTACEHIDWMMGLVNYFFTAPGVILSNYGVEGESFVYDAEGNPQYTDLVLHNPDVTVNMAAEVYAASILPFRKLKDKLYSTYDQAGMDAVDLWNSVEQTNEHTYPTAASLTADETNAISTKLTDIQTRADELLLKFVTGATPLNDNTWQEYEDSLNSLGLQEVINAYQNAYDEFLAGKRMVFSESSGGAGGPPPDGGPGGPPPA